MKLNKIKQIICIVLIVIFASVFAVSAYMMIKYYTDSKTAENEFKELSQLITPNDKPVQSADSQTVSSRYYDLYTQNSDFAGWIRVEGTNIDYPVMLTKNNEEYYLRRGFDKQYSYHGVPFIDADCVLDKSDNTVIYGHNMMDGSMFAALEKYENKSFYQQNKYINFDTLSDYGVYEIIAVVKSSPAIEKEFKYYGMINAMSEENFNTYISELKKRSLYSTDATAHYGDRLITLSTCEYSVNNGRLAVIAKKISKEN